MAKHLVKNWRGSRGAYNILKINGVLDPWTKYYVKDTDGTTTTYVEYFGENLVHIPTGQLIAVNDVLENEPESPNPYDRFLVGTDANGYKIYEYTPVKDSEELESHEMEFSWKYGVRILSRGLKSYVYYNGKLTTYDDGDAGSF